MAAQLFYYEDVEVGDGIPTLVKRPTTRQLVMWASASGDLGAIHYDKDFALSRGLPGVIVHGWLTASFLLQMLSLWVGKGNIRKLSCNFRGMHFPNEDIICKGKIVKKYIQDNDYLVECEIWAENPKGEKTTLGMAVISLPSRARLRSTL